MARRVQNSCNDKQRIFCDQRKIVTYFSRTIVFYAFDFDPDTMNLFGQLLNHRSKNVFKAVHVGLDRVLKNSSILFEMLRSAYITCYHALIRSIAYLSPYDVRQSNADGAAEVIEQYPDLLPVFVVELYNHICHFTSRLHHMRTVDYYLAYAYPQYVEIASLLAVRMPANCTKDESAILNLLFFYLKSQSVNV